MFNLIRSDMFDELTHLHREMDRLFNRFFGTDRVTGEASGLTSSPTGVQTHVFQPAVDARYDGDRWIVRLAVPGISPDQLQIDVSGQTLTVRGERPAEAQERTETWFSEIPYGRFERVVTLPAAIDPDQVKASYRHGMLELALPLRESVKPRRVEIAVEDRKALKGAA